MEGLVFILRGTYEVLVRIHSLIVKPVRSGPMKGVGTRLRREDRLQPCGTTVLDRERIHLNTSFLDRFRLWSQIQNSLTNSAGDVKTVDHVLIVVLTLTVRAGVDLLFCRKIVDSRRRTSRCARSQAGNSWSHGHQRDEVATDDRQLRHALILEGHLYTAVSGVYDWSLCADDYRLGDGAYLEGERDVQILLGEQRDCRLRLRKTSGFGRNLVVTGGEADEAVVPRIVAGCCRGDSGRCVDQLNFDLSNTGAALVLYFSLDAGCELSKRCTGTEHDD